MKKTMMAMVLVAASTTFPAFRPPAVPLVPVFPAMGLSVIHARARQLGVQLAGAVPRAAGGRDRGGMAVEALLPEKCHQVAAAYAPVGHPPVGSIITAPAGQAVHKDKPEAAHCHHRHAPAVTGTVPRPAGRPSGIPRGTPSRAASASPPDRTSSTASQSCRNPSAAACFR